MQAALPSAAKDRVGPIVEVSVFTNGFVILDLGGSLTSLSDQSA